MLEVEHEAFPVEVSVVQLAERWQAAPGYLGSALRSRAMRAARARGRGPAGRGGGALMIQRLQEPVAAMSARISELEELLDTLIDDVQVLPAVAGGTP